MARYRFSIDIGTFIGARFLSLNLTEGGKSIPGIFIPAGINGIEVQTDTRDEGKRNASGIRAFLNFQQRSCNNKYIDAVKQSLQRKGEEITLYNVPAYHLSGGFDRKNNAEKGKKEFRRKFDGGVKKSDNPDVIYGRDFEDEPIAIEKIVGEMGEVTIRCQVMSLETREIRNEKTIVIMSVTDFTDSIVLKIFTIRLGYSC